MSENTEISSLKISRRTDFNVVKASGENILTYLNGQITQDIKKLTSEQALYATVLNPQGKAVTDFYLLLTQQKENWAEVMFLCPKDFTVALIERLTMFAMGYDLRMGKVSSWEVVSVQGAGVDVGLVEQGLPVPSSTYLASASLLDAFALRMVESDDDGVWLMGANIPLTSNVDEAVMEEGRILQGTPKLGVDWDVKLHPLNANLMERQGVSFDKGCYVGQEVTSRMHWRGGIKKKLYRIQMNEKVDIPSGVLTTAKVGEITSLAQNSDGGYQGIALLPIEVVESNKPLSVEDGAHVRVIGICGLESDSV